MISLVCRLTADLPNADIHGVREGGASCPPGQVIDTKLVGHRDRHHREVTIHNRILYLSCRVHEPLPGMS